MRAAAHTFALTAACAVAVACGPLAIVNKQLKAHGHGTFESPMSMASAIFDGSSKVETAMRVIVAFVILAALVSLIAGVARTFRGDRGGLDAVVGGVFGIAALTAATTVVM